jgi:hypothetical protein
MRQENSLDFAEFVVYTNGMARPKKDPALRMDTDIRVPMTGEQKALINEATADEAQGMAAWVRGVLIDAAKRKLAKDRSKKKHGA